MMGSRRKFYGMIWLVARKRSRLLGCRQMHWGTTKIWSTLLAGLALAVVTLSLLRVGHAEDAQAGSTRGSAESAEARLRRWQRLAIFRSSDDQSTTLAQLGLGRRPLLLVLWATWCEPCVKEMPRLVQLHKTFAATTAFVGVAQDLHSAENRRAINQLATRGRLPFPQFAERDGDTLEAQLMGDRATALPAFVLFAADGTLRYARIGSLDIPEHLARLESELRAMQKTPQVPPVEAPRRAAPPSASSTLPIHS